MKRTGPCRRLLILVILLSGASGVALGQPIAVGGEFQVNSLTTNHQYWPRVAMNGDGTFVVVWRNQYDIQVEPDRWLGRTHGRLFDAGGGPVADFQVNAYTGATQYLAEVAIGTQGDFVVVWANYLYPIGNRLFGQRFAADGSSLGADFEVDPEHAFVSSVASFDAGGFIVAWQGDTSLSGPDLLGLRYDSGGAPLGNRFKINSDTTCCNSLGAVASGPEGGFVVAWHQRLSPSVARVLVRRFEADGTPAGVEFQVNSDTAQDAQKPHVATDDAGDFVVAWRSYEPGYGYGSGIDVAMRSFSSAGTAASGEIQVNSYTTAAQVEPRVAASGPDDLFVVVWASHEQDGSGAGVFGQLFGPGGTRLGVEFQVNSYTTDDQTLPSVAAGASGDFVVVWNSRHQDGSQLGVFGQRYRFPSPLIFADGFESGDAGAWSGIVP